MAQAGCLERGTLERQAACRGDGAALPRGEPAALIRFSPSLFCFFPADPVGETLFKEGKSQAWGSLGPGVQKGKEPALSKSSKGILKGKVLIYLGFFLSLLNGPFW